ncbi:MAG: hypothetical protein IJB37_03625 [Peptococcaceae bacterium]|nr:hypothetical protein [Peptococcaceae bacterium]
MARYLLRLCIQMAGAIGVFFFVMSLFQWTAPEAVPLKQAVRACFTTDTDVMPVIEWLNQSGKNDDNTFMIDEV